MAGILFTDRNLVLAGFNQHTFSITGIGGKAKSGELPHQTAIRETLEELFEFVEIPETLTRLVCAALKFENSICTKGYTTFVMSFDDLNKIIRLLQFVNVESRVYSKIPTNLTELLLNRIRTEGAEFSHLALLPCAYNLSLNRYFLDDIYAFKNCENIIT